MHRRKRLRGSQRITFSAMTVALGLVCVYAASLLPGGSPALYFIASMLAAGLVLESEAGLSVAAYIATGALSLLIVPNKLMTLPYVVLMGHYCIFKLVIERRVKGIIALVPKLIYLNAFAALGIWLAMRLFGYDALTALPIPLWAFIALAEVVFVAYDWLLSYTVRFYDAALRPLLIGKSRR